MMNIAEGVVLALLGTSFEPASILVNLLYLAGLWAVLRKSGVKGWWALVPCARQYKLGLCAGREPEGRTLAVMDFLLVFSGGLLPLPDWTRPLADYTIPIMASR